MMNEFRKAERYSMHIDGNYEGLDLRLSDDDTVIFKKLSWDEAEELAKWLNCAIEMAHNRQNRQKDKRIVVS